MRNGLLVQDLKFGFIIPFVIASVFWNFGVSCCLAREQALGKLKIEGKHIEKLVLHRRDGHTKQFNEPAETIKLAVGEYRLQEVRLKGGFTCNSLRTSTYNWVTVTENEPAILKVGAPLKQTVKIERQGLILVLNYDLTGVGGESYAVARSKRPMFTVFKGEKEVTTSEFEFG